MIPIKIQKDGINVKDIKELEYKYLVEIPKEVQDNWKYFNGHYSDNNCDNNKLLELFTDNRFDLYRYIGSIGETNLFFYDYGIYKSPLTQDFLYYACGYENMGFVIDNEVLKDMVGKELDCSWIDTDKITEILKTYENQEISIGDFIKKFNEYKKKEEEEEIERQKEEELRREEEIKGNELEIDKFNNGIWREDDKDVYGIGNTIYYSGKEYMFDKAINKLFTIEELNNAYRKYNNYGIDKLDWVESLSILKDINYAFTSQDKKRNYNVKFKDDKMYVGGLAIPKSRSVFFVSRANGDKEQLKILKELSAIKVEFLGLKTIELSTPSYTYRNIPVEVEYIDKLFKITLLDKTIKADWKDLELFRYNIQSLKSRFYVDDIENIRLLFNISKSELFDFMKKTQLLDKLGEENEND